MIRTTKFTIGQKCPHCNEETFIMYELGYDDDNPMYNHSTLPTGYQYQVPNKVRIYCSKCMKDV